MDRDLLKRALDADFGSGLTEQADDYSYTNLSGVDLLTNQDAVKDVRDYYAAQGETFSNYSDMWDKFYSDRRWNSVNTIGAASSLIESTMAGDDRDRLARLSKIWANAPMRGTTLDRVWDYGKGALLDPTNLIPVAGQAGKAKSAFTAARTAGKTLQQSKNAGRTAGAMQAAKQEAVIGGAVGGAQDLMQQATEVQQGLSDGIDVGRLAGSVAIDAGASGVAGGLLDRFGTSSVGRSLPVVNRLLGGDYADDLGNWSNTTNLGQNLTKRSQALARELDDIETKLGEDYQLEVDADDLAERKANIELELADIEADGVLVDDLNTKMDQLAEQIQAGQKNGVDVKGIQREYQKTAREFERTTKKKRLPSRQQEAEVEAPDVEVEAETGDPLQITDQSATNLLPPPSQRTVEEGEVIAIEPQEGQILEVDEAAEVKTTETTEDEAVALPDVPLVARNKQAFTQLLEANSDIINQTEINALASEGKLRLTASTKAIGKNAMEDLQKIVDERRAAPVQETVRENVQEPAKPAAKEANEPTAATTAEEVGSDTGAAEFAPSANPDLEDQADELMPRMMMEVAGSNTDPLVAIRTQAIPGRDDISPPLKRILMQRLNNLEMLRARKAGASVRQDETTQGRTNKRTADRTDVSIDRLQDVPPYVPDEATGRMVRNPEYVEAGIGPSFSMKASRDIGGGNFSTTSTGTRPKEFARSAAMRMAEADTRKKEGKLFYPYTSFVGDVHADGTTQSGEGAVTAYYFPFMGKSFRDINTALKAMETNGVKVNENYAAYDEDMIPIFTDREYASEKDKLLKRFGDKKITKKVFDQELIKLNQRAEGAMDTPQKKEVIGRNGEIIERVKAGIPNTKGKKIIAAIPRSEFSPSGNLVTSKVLSARQQKAGVSAEALIGNEDAKDWYIGYVPANMRTKTTDIDAMIEKFEPLNESNKVGEVNRTNPTAPPAPIDLESRGDVLIVDTSSLETNDINNLFFASSIAKNKGINLFGDVKSPEDLRSKEITLRDLTRLEAIVDNAPWEIDFNVNGQSVPMNNKLRLRVLATLHDLNGSVAPSGIRRPSIDIEESLVKLNGIFDKSSPTTRSNMERLMRMVVPDQLAPIFETADMDATVLGRFVNDRNDALNRIQLNPEAINKALKEKGLSETHVVAHELGHWVYNNLMSNPDKAEFWRAIDQYYDGEGRLYKDGDRDAMRDIALRSPYFKSVKKSVGFDNALDSPSEYFANQFALFMNHKYDLMMWPDTPFFTKAMKLAKKLWYLMSRKEILDPELEPIFSKLISRKDLQMRDQFMRPKEPTNKYSLTLMANYENLRVGKAEVDRAFNSADISAFIEKIKQPEHGLESQLRRLVATENDAKFYARRKGEEYKGYTGVLKAIQANGLADKLRNVLVELESIGVGRTAEGKKGFTGTFATEYPIEDIQAMSRIYENDLVPAIEQAMKQLNDTCYRLEKGDIPTAKLDSYDLKARQETGMKKIEKSATAKVNFGETSRKRNQRKNFVAESIKALKGKKTDFNEADFADFAASQYPDMLPLVGKLEEAFKKGAKPKNVSAIATRMREIISSNLEVSGPATVVRTTKAGDEGPYQNANNNELAVVLREGLMGTGDKNKIQDVAWEYTRRDKKNKAVVPDSNAVINAVKAEAEFNRGGLEDNGIGSNTPFILSNFLSEITARTPQKETAARKLATRVLALGYEISPDTRTDDFKEFRTMARQLSANLETTDITQTVRTLTKTLYPTSILSDGTRNLLENTAARMGYDADSVLEQLVIEDVDMTVDRVLMDQIKDTLPEFEGYEIEEAVNEAREAMRDAIAYTVNGLVDAPEARSRFLPLALYGDMASSESLVTRNSPAGVYTDVVPAEFASEFAAETINRMSQASVDAVKDFTGSDDIKMMFITPERADSIFGSLPVITDRPANTMDAMRDAIVDSAPEARKTVVADLIDQSEAIRNGINSARADGTASDLSDHYMFDSVVNTRLSNFKASDLTTTKPVFLRDDKPAVFGHQMTFKDDMVRGVIEAIRQSAKTPSRLESINNFVADNRGLFKGREVFSSLSELAGGNEQLRRIMRQANYSTITVDGQTVLLTPRKARPASSEEFIKAQPLLGEVEVGSGANAHIVSEARMAIDDGEAAVMQTADALTKAGMPKGAAKAMIKMRKKKSLNERDVQEVRTVLTTDTQSGIIRRAGMPSLADFAEPADGSGGHFERIHGRMAKFLSPMTKALNELPDSKNPMGRWFDAGLRQMYDTTAEFAARKVGDGESIMGFNVVRGEQQPKSHRRIADALGNQDQMPRLLKTKKEREIYSMIRKYLDDVKKRLQDAGENVGVIAENYFPQVWRVDLINSNRPEFERKLAKYFLAEHKERFGSNSLSPAEAAQKAKDVTKQIVDDGGVNLPRSKVFSSGSGQEDFFKERMLRIDQFPEFNDASNMKDNLGVFMEKDLMVVMSKYSENAERRLDITDKFGPEGHGMTDYVTILRNTHDAVSRLLSTHKILKPDYHVLASGNEPDLNGPAVMKMQGNSALFKAPFPSKEKADFFTEQLVKKAAAGAKRDELVRTIMDRMQPTADSDEFSDQMRKNFRKRAEAIGSALEDTRGFTKTPSEKNVVHAEKYIDLVMQKPNGSEAWRKASSALRMINGVTLLSFTTLTSLGDLVLPLIRSGDFKSWSTALGNYMRDPVAGSAYRDMIRNVGVAVENTVHQRMSNSYGIDANRFTTGFFTATALTPWTDMMREISGATAFEHFKASARIAQEAPNTRQGRLAKRALDEFGLQSLYDKGAPHIDMIMRSGGTEAEHPMYETVQSGMIKFANESIFAPNKNDLPQWATAPAGQLIFQLKSFPLKMLRLGRYAFKEALRSDDPNYAPLLLYMTAGPAMGFTAANVKDVVQSRGGEDNRQAEFRERKLSKTVTPLEGMLSDNADKALGWYWDGFMTMGGLGILGELMYDTVNQVDNGAYGKVRIAETFMGPSSGLFFDALTIAEGGMSAVGDAISGEGTNGKERAAVREIVSRAPLIGQHSGMRESIVDRIAGEKGSRG